MLHHKIYKEKKMVKEKELTKNEVVIKLTDWQSECLDKIVENAKNQKENEGAKITREIILSQFCKRFIGETSGKLIAQE